MIENLLNYFGNFVSWIVLYPQISWSHVIGGASYCGIRSLVHHDHNLTNYKILRILGGTKHHLRHHQNTNVNYGVWWIDYLCCTNYK